MHAYSEEDNLSGRLEKVETDVGGKRLHLGESTAVRLATIDRHRAHENKTTPRKRSCFVCNFEEKLFVVGVDLKEEPKANERTDNNSDDATCAPHCNTDDSPSDTYHFRIKCKVPSLLRFCF